MTAMYRSKFPEDLVPELIEAVKRREFLYNPAHEDFKVRFVSWSAWREIARDFGCSVDHVKMKWKNLRDIFNKEIRRFKCKSVEDYPGKWKYFETLSFMMNPGQINDKDETCDAEEHKGDDDDDFFEVGTTTTEPKMKYEVTREPHEVYLEDFNDSDTLEPEISINPAKRKKRNNSGAEDYDMMYLKSLLPYFKELDPIRNLTVRNKIQDILLNELTSQNEKKNK